VGLELNEPPLLGNNNHEVLEEGMIIALELEMSASIGEVVKLEDTILITPEGVEVLTITPRELHQI
jgi:Xaa-Pro aminopeptidase